MAYSFELVIGVNQDEREKVAVEFSDADWALLSRYLEDFELLAATRMGEHCQVKFKYLFDAEKGFSYSSEMPPEDDVAAFLHRLRPFVLKNEPASFYRICKILGRAIAHPGMTALLRKQRDEFSGRAFQSQLQFSSNGITVNAEDVLQNWLNAYEYHRDPDRRDELKKIHHEHLPLEAIRPIFLSMLIDKAGAVAEIAKIVRLILTRQKGREVRFRKLSITPKKDG